MKLLIGDTPREGTKVKNLSFIEIEEAIPSVSADFEPSFLPANEIISIIYTSGTSGKPKGVMHTAENFCMASRIARDTMYFSSFSFYNQPKQKLAPNEVVRTCLFLTRTVVKVYLLFKINWFKNCSGSEV